MSSALMRSDDLLRSGQHALYTHNDFERLCNVLCVVVPTCTSEEPHAWQFSAA